MPTAKSVEINVEFGGCSGFPHVVGPGIVDFVRIPKNIHIKVKIHNSLFIDSQPKVKIFPAFFLKCLMRNELHYAIII